MHLVQAKHLFVYGLKLASKMLIIPNKVCYTIETQSISLLLTLWLSLYFQNMTLWSRGMPVLYHWNFATFTYTFTFTLLQFGQNMTFWSWEMPVQYHGHFATFTFTYTFTFTLLQVGQNMTLWSREMPVLYHGHFAHFPLRKLGLSTSPIYINLIRYIFQRWGNNR